MVLYLLAFVLFCIGLFSALFKKNVLKIILGIVIMEYAASLLFVLVAYRAGGEVPLVLAGGTLPVMVDPLPQSCVLVLLLVNLSVLAVAAAIAIRIYEKYHTFDITEVRRLRG